MESLVLVSNSCTKLFHLSTCISVCITSIENTYHLWTFFFQYWPQWIHKIYQHLTQFYIGILLFSDIYKKKYQSPSINYTLLFWQRWEMHITQRNREFTFSLTSQQNSYFSLFPTLLYTKSLKTSSCDKLFLVRLCTLPWTSTTNLRYEAPKKTRLDLQ